MVRRPQLVALGAALQYTLMPLMGYAVTRLFQLPVAYSVGCALPAQHAVPAHAHQAGDWPQGECSTAKVYQTRSQLALKTDAHTSGSLQLQGRSRDILSGGLACMASTVLQRAAKLLHVAMVTTAALPAP